MAVPEISKSKVVHGLDEATDRAQPITITEDGTKNRLDVQVEGEVSVSGFATGVIDHADDDILVYGAEDGSAANTHRPLNQDASGRTRVVGGADDGASATGIDPVLVGGVDGSGNAQNWKMSTGGTGAVAQVTTSTALADGLSNTANIPIDEDAATIEYRVLPYWFNGTTWDRAKGDTTSGLLVNPAAPQTLNNGAETSVTGTAASILAADTTRKAAIVQNVGSANIRVGASGVTATTGVRLAPGDTLTLGAVTSAIFAIREGSTSSTALAQGIT